MRSGSPVPGRIRQVLWDTAYRALWCAALSAIAVVAAYGQTATPSPGQPATPPLPADIDLTQPLTLAECIDIALAVNPALTIAENRQRQASARVTQARSAWLPNLSVEGSASATDRSGTSGGGGGLPSAGGSTTSWGADLVLSQTLYRSGLEEEIGSARASARASGFGLDDSRRSIVLGVAESYYAALAAKALVDVAGRAVASSTQHVEVAQDRIAVGSAAAADVYPFEVELAQARVALISAENQMQTSLTTLKEAIGLPSEMSVQLADQLGRPELAGELPDLIQTAYRDRPDVREQQAVVDSARYDLRAAEIQRGPVVNVGGSADHSVGDGAGTVAQVQAAVAFPVFDGGQTRAGVKSARAALDAASEALRQLQISVSADVERSYLDAVEAGERIDAAETALRAAQVSADAANGRYAEGAGTVVDATDAEVRLRQTDADRVQAYYDYNAALAALAAAIGQSGVPAGETP